MIVVVMIVVMVVVMIVVTEVTVVILVRAVVVLYPPVLSVPVAAEVLPPVMVGSNPMSSLVRRPSPIAVVPLVVISDRVPVALDPDKVRPWSRGKHGHGSGGWRRANPNPDRDLRVSCRSAQAKQKRQKNR